MIAVLHACTLSVFLAAPPGASPVDPILPEELREAVTRASEAELDPKRGTQNAVELLKSEKAKLGANQRLTLALDLRTAATVLRKRFLLSEEFPPPQRYEQALSTFSRLELTEPGLGKWIERALQNHPEAAKKMGKKAAWKMRAAILTRGASLDRQAVTRAFEKAFEKVGVKFEVVPAKEAALVLTVGAEDAPSDDPAKRAIKLNLGLESIRDGNVVWRHGLYRIEAAHEPQVALSSGLDWVARIGGRDLLFRWLGETAFPTLMDTRPRAPGGDSHDHDAHGEAKTKTKPGISPVGTPEDAPIKVTIPKTNR